MTGAGARPGDYRDYAVFGLRVRSNVELPELFPAYGAAAPDVTIELGSIPTVTHGEDDGLNHVNGALVLVIPEVARYRIEAGNRITVDSEPGVPEPNVRLFLLGSAFGVLLHQRGLLPLHANAIEIDGRAVAFMGPSGAGKSTLGVWFHDQGYNVLADDVCVVRFDAEGRAVACPGLPRLRLWPDAILFTGRNTQDFKRSYAGSGNDIEKFDVPVMSAEPRASDIPLAALYVLERGDVLAIEPLHGIAAAEPIFANTYRGSYVAAAGSAAAHWQAASRVAQIAPVFRLERKWDLNRAAEQCEAIIRHARGVAG